MSLPDPDLWVVLGKGQDFQPQEPFLVSGSLPSGINELLDISNGLNVWDLKTKTEGAELFKNELVNKIFKTFISKSRTLQEDLDMHETLLEEDLNDLYTLKEELVDTINNQFPEFPTDHMIYHIIDLLSLRPKSLLLSFTQDLAKSLQAKSIEEKTLAVNGFGKQSPNQPFWSKVVSDLTAAGIIEIALAIPEVQTYHIALSLPQDELKEIQEMSKEAFQSIFSHVLEEDWDMSQNSEAIRVSQKIKESFMDLLPIISHILLTRQNANFDLSQNHIGIQFQTNQKDVLPSRKTRDTADEAKRGEQNFRSAYLIRKLTGIRKKKKSPAVIFSDLKNKIQSLRAVSSGTLDKIGTMYRENKPFKNSNFRKIFTRWIECSENCRKEILLSLSETGKFPPNYQSLKEEFLSYFANVCDFIFSNYDEDFFSEGESSLFQELMGIKEDILEENHQYLTDSFPLMGLDPETYNRLYPNKINRSDVDVRMIANAEFTKRASYMKDDIGEKLARRYYRNMQHAPKGMRYLSSAYWESKVSEGENPYFQHGCCFFGMAKYSKTEREWICIREAVISLDIRHLPINSREKLEALFISIKNICDLPNEDPKEILGKKPALFTEDEIKVLSEYAAALKDVVELTTAKVRYAICSPEINIPGVRKFD